MIMETIFSKNGNITQTEGGYILSIVVPVYNTEKFLSGCLDSLINQDLAENQYEIICVNDGSTDGSYEILQKYSEQYKNIKIINQKNSGHAAARNVGLDIASGLYIWFVDSDDCVDIQSFGFITKVMLEKDADILCINYHPFQDDNEIPKIPKKYTENSRDRKSEIACSGIRIFKTQMLRSSAIKWNDKLSPCDDIEFIFYANMNSKNIIYNKSVSYYHRQWSGSVTHQKSLESRQKYLSSFLLLANEYNAELKKEKYSEKQKKEIEARRNLSVQAVLMNLALYENLQTIEQYLVKLKKDGLYPYKKITYNLIPKISIKRTIMDYALYFITNEHYYRFFVKVIKKFK